MERVSVSSHTGMRDNIEDAYGSVRLVYRGSTGESELAIYVVADGVGGSKGGEQASLIAIETCTIDLPRFLCRQTTGPDPDVPSAIDQAVELANARILERGSARASIAWPPRWCWSW